MLTVIWLLILQELNILADFGIAFLYSLNHSAISATHTPSLILLPSSSYRISPAEKREEASIKADTQLLTACMTVVELSELF